MSSKIMIMISSRCKDCFPLSSKVSLTDIRKKLKEEIEALTLFDIGLYEVWINENAVEDGARPSWDKCIEKARDCHIFIALYNGNAGWLGTGNYGTVGICHAEYEAAYTAAPGKVFTVNIFEKENPNRPKRRADLRFQKYIEKIGRLDSRPSNGDELEKAVKQIVVQATVKLFLRGVRDAARGTTYVGPALDWSRLNYEERASKMRKSAVAGLNGNQVPAQPQGNLIRRSIANKSILFSVSAIPDAMSIATAREVVGQPHLRDHSLATELAPCDGGPIHLIACHKGVSEFQATRMLGFPNATVVSGPSWVYVVDPVQSIQMVLISQCRDDASTRLGVHSFLEWLDESEQSAELVRHAKKRKLVVNALAT